MKIYRLNTTTILFKSRYAALEYYIETSRPPWNHDGVNISEHEIGVEEPTQSWTFDELFDLIYKSRKYGK